MSLGSMSCMPWTSKKLTLAGPLTYTAIGVIWLAAHQDRNSGHCVSSAKATVCQL